MGAKKARTTRASKREKGQPKLGPDDRVHRGRNRDAQIVRYPRRKLFNRERRKIFLEWFAATANMSWSAEVAGVSYKTVSKHILKDAEFAGLVRDAMGLGVLRAKAKAIETKRREPKIGIDGDLEVPELDMTRDEARQAVREHERTLMFGRKPGRAPRIASNAEVVAVVRKRLKVFAARVRARRVLRDGPSTGSVPPQDERLV